MELSSDLPSRIALVEKILPNLRGSVAIRLLALTKGNRWLRTHLDPDEILAETWLILTNANKISEVDLNHGGKEPEKSMLDFAVSIANYQIMKKLSLCVGYHAKHFELNKDDTRLCLSSCSPLDQIILKELLEGISVSNQNMLFQYADQKSASIYRTFGFKTASAFRTRIYRLRKTLSQGFFGSEGMPL